MALSEATQLSSISSDEELSAPEGWKKKVVPKKGGTPKKKDVVYIAPDGEEIKTKRQLDKWLKNHPGNLSSGDFDWSTGETPRRSLRLSSKGRLLSDNTDVEPAPKRSKSDQDEDPVVYVSPRKSLSLKRKSAPPPDDTGNEEVTDKAEKVDGPQETGADGIGVDADAKTASEKVDNILENNSDGKIEKEDVSAAVQEVEQGDVKDQVSSEEVAISGNSIDHITVDEQLLRGEEPVVVTETVVEEVTPVVIVQEAVPAGADGLPATEEPVKPSEVDITIKDVEGTKTVEDVDSVHVPAPVDTAEQVHEVLKPTETIEIQESHVVVEEPALAGVPTSPKQQNEISRPAAEQFGVST